MDEPRLIPEHVHRALMYIERLNLVGVRPSVSQVEGLALSDGPSPARYRSIYDSFGSNLAWTLTRTKVSDAEPVVKYMKRMGWILTSGELTAAVELSDLGRALLVALRADVPGEFREHDGAVSVVLDPENPFVYSDLTRAVAAAGSGMVVDPYFKAAHLDWLLSSTTVERLLIRHSNEVGQFEVALYGLRKLPHADRLQVRVTRSQKLHDRCLVKADGGIDLLGTSVTGVGRHLSTITPLPDSARAAMRRHLNKLWDDAVVVEAKGLDRPVVQTETEPGPAVSQVQ